MDTLINTCFFLGTQSFSFKKRENIPKRQSKAQIEFKKKKKRHRLNRETTKRQTLHKTLAA